MKKNGFWYPSTVGLICTVFGLALCRFSYTPMIPFLINQHWLTAAQANYIGSYNFIGYFVGAVLAFSASTLLSRQCWIRLSLVLALVSLTACSWHVSYVWMSVWRFLAGVVGAFLVILSPAFVLSFVDGRMRFAASGIVFAGAGLGIIVSSLLIPSMAMIGLSFMWLVFAGFALVCTALAWRLLGKSMPVECVENSSTNVKAKRMHFVLWLLAISYFCCGAGVVPHTLFLSHYLHADLQVGLQSSGSLFALFGVGCLLGSVLGGMVSARIGVYATLLVGYIIGLVAMLLVVLTHALSFVLLSSVLVGIYLFITVNLTSLRVGEVVPSFRHPKYWGRLTVCFALGQACGGFAMSHAVAIGCAYLTMFWWAAIALLVGLVAVLFSK